MLRVILAAGAIALATQAQATTITLDFSGDICNGGNACFNGSSIDQSYGDIAGQLDVVYDADRNTAALEDLLSWGTGYETLTGVAYGLSSAGGWNSAGGLSIELQAVAGYQVTLMSFDIAPYSQQDP